MAPDLRAARARELYSHLPELYRSRDWLLAAERVGEEALRSGREIPALEAFLSLVAEQIIGLRGNIDELWDDFFIETCAEWVVPYLGDLLGTRMVFNAAQRNRVDVRNTVEWRRRKGILSMLAELARDITGWGADAAEFFENLGWAQQLNHCKADHVQAPDLRDPYRLSLLGTAADPWLHSVDVRRPQGSVGRYGIKTIGFFLSRLNAYPLRGVTPVSLDPERFTFDPLGRDLPLFHGGDRQPITAAAYSADPYRFYGDDEGMSIRQHGIHVATGRPPEPEPTEPAAMWTGFGPESGADHIHLGANGLQLMEPEKFASPMRRFVLTALWGTDFAAAPVPLGTLETLGAVFATAPGAEAAGPGSLLLTVALAAGAQAAVFPATVVAVRNDRPVPRVADSRTGRYRDALYVYLPEVLLDTGDTLNLYVGADGTTFYAQRAAPHLGPGDVLPSDIFAANLDRTLIARTGLGQCFPPRRLSHSLQPSDLVDLHRATGLRLADERLFLDAPGEHPARQFVIEARQFQRQTLATALVGRLATVATAGLTPFRYAPDPGSQPRSGVRLLLTIRPVHPSDTLFPMTDLIVTDRSGRALLVALPEMDFTTFPAPVSLLFDTEGASYYASADFGHDTALARPERDEGGAYRFDPLEPDSGLARGSPGQVLAAAGKVPLQHRTPVYATLCDWDHPKPRPPRSGQLAIDPVRGRFRFATGEGPALPLSGDPLRVGVDYHEGFAADVGALSYDRYASLKAPDHPQPTRYVASSGDANQDGGAVVHSTLAQAVLAAQDGDVIQIEDSATYDHTATLTISGGATPRLVIQAANRQRPCLRFSGGAGLRVTGPIEALRLNGLLVSGAALEILDASLVQQLELVACSFDPVASAVGLIAGEGLNPSPRAQITLCRCVLGGLQLSGGVAELLAAESIIDRRGGIAIADLLGKETGATVHLERCTVWGRTRLHQLYGSECLLVDECLTGDQQNGCLRYSRFQVDSRLPRRFACVPSDNRTGVDPVTPVFNSRRFGRPAYGQLHLRCPASVSKGAEDGAEMGAFHDALGSLREKNLRVKLDEYLPVGLTPALIYVT